MHAETGQSCITCMLCSPSLKQRNNFVVNSSRDNRYLHRCRQPFVIVISQLMLTGGSQNWKRFDGKETAGRAKETSRSMYDAGSRDLAHTGLNNEF